MDDYENGVESDEKDDRRKRSTKDQVNWTPNNTGSNYLLDANGNNSERVYEKCPSTVSSYIDRFLYHNSKMSADCRQKRNEIEENI